MDYVLAVKDQQQNKQPDDQAGNESLLRLDL